MESPPGPVMILLEESGFPLRKQIRDSSFWPKRFILSKLPCHYVIQFLRCRHVKIQFQDSKRSLSSCTFFDFSTRSTGTSLVTCHESIILDQSNSGPGSPRKIFQCFPCFTRIKIFIGFLRSPNFESQLQLQQSTGLARLGIRGDLHLERDYCTVNDSTPRNHQPKPHIYITEHAIDVKKTVSTST